MSKPVCKSQCCEQEASEELLPSSYLSQTVTVFLM